MPLEAPPLAPATVAMRERARSRMVAARDDPRQARGQLAGELPPTSATSLLSRLAADVGSLISDVHMHANRLGDPEQLQSARVRQHEDVLQAHGQRLRLIDNYQRQLDRAEQGRERHGQVLDGLISNTPCVNHLTSSSGSSAFFSKDASRRLNHKRQRHRPNAHSTCPFHISTSTTSRRTSTRARSLSRHCRNCAKLLSWLRTTTKTAALTAC